MTSQNWRRREVVTEFDFAELNCYHVDVDDVLAWLRLRCRTMFEKGRLQIVDVCNVLLRV
jgi:hypothetical protein